MGVTAEVLGVNIEFAQGEQFCCSSLGAGGYWLSRACSAF